MDRNKIYEKRARLYPLIVTTALPLGLLSYFLIGLLAVKINFATKLAISIIPTGLLTAAVAYFCKNIIRSISKWIFQRRFFKEDESYMPTVELLLWNNNSFTDDKKKRIREKIKSKFHIELPTKQSEIKNERQARRLISEIVPQIREITRDNDILFDYNCYFGSVRNALGGCIIAMLILIFLFLANFKNPVISQLWLAIPFIVYLLSVILAKPLLKYFGYEYARKLYDVFMKPSSLF